MLVLTRKQQEKIQIGDDIVITVLKTKGKTVRLGIEAPGTVAVLRGELAERDELQRNTTAEFEVDLVEDEAELPRDASQHSSAVDNASRSAGALRSDGWESVGVQGVSHQRVSRSRVGTVLPKMLGEKMLGERGLGERAPLRAMLDRRAVAAQAAS